MRNFNYLKNFTINNNMEIETTNLDELPSNNINLSTTEKNELINNPGIEELNNRKMEESVNHELINGLQQAATVGSTQLPSRDIPMDTNQIQSDESIKPNFIPQEDVKTDYITKHQTTEEIIRQNKNNVDKSNQWDQLYKELNLPILIASLFFIFQLPIVQKQFITMLPFCYSDGGNIKLTGRLTQCLVFGLIIFFSSKIVLFFDN